MKRSIATVCLSGDLRQKIEAAAFAGFDGIEIFENDLMLFDESPSVVKKMADDVGLKIIALQPFRDFECMPASKMQKNFDRAERKFDLMQELGTESLLICSNVSPQCIDNRTRSVDEFTELAERAAKRNFKLGYEALAWGRYVKDYQDAWSLVQQVDHDSFGIILDSFHIFARGRDLSTLREIPGNRITLVQLADAPWMDMDVLQWSRHFRCFPGQGDFPVVEFMKDVINTGYDGYFSHEIFNDEFRSAPCRVTAADGMRSLLWLQEEVSKAAPDTSAMPENDEEPCPYKANIERVEFIEFAAEGRDKDSLIHLLHCLGFRKTHVHRSRDVSLYRQGDVSIVVNEEPDSFAQQYYLLHGVSVCAIAYLTDDSESMLDRATYYGYQKYEGDIEHGEMDIPGIKGVGGQLVYFIQETSDGSRFFDVDFVEVPLEESLSPLFADNMLVDHITSGVSESEFLPTTLFYKALFGFGIDQPKDLIDPYGIVVSRTATNSTKNIRLPFNMSKSWGASTERFREEHRGSGVQHIALSCDDILKFARTVDKDIILPIPENYYNDLEARFDLEPELAKNLRDNNMMYDFSETGYFIHFYTRTINGVFFEIVQRHRYSNYGEVNAHVRMAAQSRRRKTELAEQH